MSPILKCVVRAGLLALAGLSAPALAAVLVEADPDWSEGEVSMPSAPRDTTLRVIDIGTPSPNIFLVDESSVGVGADGVVRYTLVVRTPGGAENVTFEGIRCATGEHRLYASGRKDGSWTPLKTSAWSPIVDNGYNRPRAALAWDYFCDGPAGPRDRDHALRLLRHKRDPNNRFGTHQ
ncbi:MAG: CNP1-like family protein [Thauera sp.]